MAPTKDLTLEVPKKGKCRWLKAVMGLQEWEMMGALGAISSKTLSNWLADPSDTAAMNSPEFNSLLDLVRAARGVIRPERLADWLHEPSEEFGEMPPVELLMRPESRIRVLATLRDLKHGNLA